jgi:GH15 family glucan-1,4-alpha-glucosidase
MSDKDRLPASLDGLADLVSGSIALIRNAQHPSGAYPASRGYPTYAYCWFRDGGYIADAMSRVSEVDSAERFFDWCGRVLVDRADRIRQLTERLHRDGTVDTAKLLPTRYELDGTDSEAPWADFQVDGYGSWIKILLDHCARHRRTLDRYASAINLSVDYLVAVGTHPCFDWWEEHSDQVHVATLAAVASGLQAALDSGVLSPDRRASAAQKLTETKALIDDAAAHAGHLTKWLGTDVVDGSLLSCIVPLNVVAIADPIAQRTLRLIQDTLLQDGLYRYRGDTFYGGGEWIILTAWLGWCQLLQGDIEAARNHLAWILRQEQNGLLPEQVSTSAQFPEYIEVWRNKWGPVATPLLWSHAMFLTLAKEFNAG